MKKKLLELFYLFNTYYFIVFIMSLKTTMSEKLSGLTSRYNQLQNELNILSTEIEKCKLEEENINKTDDDEVVFDLRDFSSELLEQIFHCLVETIYNSTNIRTNYINENGEITFNGNVDLSELGQQGALIKCFYHDVYSENTGEDKGIYAYTSYIPSKYEFDETFRCHFADMFSYDIDWWLKEDNPEHNTLTDDEKEIKKMIFLLNEFHKNTDVMNVKFITKYPVLLKNRTGPSCDDRGADNKDCKLPTLSEYIVSDSNEWYFKDLCEASYIVKTKKFDTWYELYNGCNKLVIDDDKQQISMFVDFGHGS